jgi:replicative DNA helicase
MSKTEILYKLISLISDIKIAYLETKILNKKDWENVQEACTILINSPLLIDDKGLSSFEYIKTQSQENNVNKCIIIIDYLQLININHNNAESRTQEIGNITRELKLLAQRLKTTIIVLSQLNRNIENRINKRPLLSDLRESGCIDYNNLPNIHSCGFNPCIEIQLKILQCMKVLSNTHSAC